LELITSRELFAVFHSDGKGQVTSFNWKDDPSLADLTMTAPTDFLVIAGGFNPDFPYNGINQPNFADRLSIESPRIADKPDAVTKNQIVCCK